MTALEIDKGYFNYCSKEIRVGRLALGGKQSVRIQSMTNTPTAHIPESLRQCLALWESGCELVRVAVPGMKEAKALHKLREELNRACCYIPLCADIHFLPEVALEAASKVEKIRINPGNYVDRHGKTGNRNISQEEVMTLARENLKPLISRCKDWGTVIRIGVNHGSLSRRILQLYGNTPEGMVASALEFIDICEELDFQNLVISMKASSVGTTVRATRLLAAQLLTHGTCYPLHLGVTEAGEGEEGRMKSFAGIGTLLGDGLGDTIRVSLTGDPVSEIDVAKSLRDFYAPNRQQQLPPLSRHRSPYSLRKQGNISSEGIGGSKPPVVIVSQNTQDQFFCEESQEEKMRPDFYFQPSNGPELGTFMPLDKGEKIPVYSMPGPPIPEPGTTYALLLLDDVDIKTMVPAQDRRPIMVKPFPAVFSKKFLEDVLNELSDSDLSSPIIGKIKISHDLHSDPSMPLSAILAPILLEGFLDGIWLENSGNESQLTDLAFQILQACGRRNSRTTYISCPSCGRTSFDIQGLLKEIKAATFHLNHLCIGVMGCVVNGPGEMAEADYGCVGAGAGKVNLYKASKLVQRCIPQERATEALISLIKESGDWKDALDG